MSMAASGFNLSFWCITNVVLWEVIGLLRWIKDHFVDTEIQSKVQFQKQKSMVQEGLFMQIEYTDLPEQPGTSLYPAVKKWSYGTFSYSAAVIV